MNKNKKAIAVLLFFLEILSIIIILAISPAYAENKSNSTQIIVNIIPHNYLTQNSSTNTSQVNDNSTFGKIIKFMESLKNKNKNIALAIITTAMIAIMIAIAILIESMHRRKNHSSLTSMLHIENEKEIEKEI